MKTPNQQFKAVRTCSGVDPQFNGALVLNGKTVVTQYTAETPEEAEAAWKNAQESARQLNDANFKLQMAISKAPFKS